MTRRKPIEGETVRILPDFGDPIECEVYALLSTMFTVHYKGTGGTYFLYYDPFKGDTWEYAT